jgi:hypothetical protein
MHTSKKSHRPGIRTLLNYDLFGSYWAENDGILLNICIKKDAGRISTSFGLVICFIMTCLARIGLRMMVFC